MHIPVLLHDTVSVLALRSDSVLIDCTLGGGGHAREALKIIGPEGVYVGIDIDPKAIEAQAALTEHKAQVHLVNDSFTNIKQIVTNLNITPNVILADLGWRSEQFDGGGKGFSFSQDEPLLMTFGDPAKHVFTAHDIVNEWNEDSLIDIIKGYGEERFAGRIAKAIVKSREEGEIKTSKQLEEIIYQAVPSFTRHGRIHPATRTFQAIRIAVNDELGALKTLLQDGFECLAPSGRLAIISFHSLEDRIVKQFFNQLIHDQKALKLIKKPIIANEDERKENPRSRSAKLRVIEKI